ncbi:stathmin domain-containing protein 1 [Polyodon spathula]|uniref:stathmin domain-containing protein 1 n=1 Tax=Polyodon spathula TaxID=7913 RepID=UPI001B7ECD10|nr:stathmin domain-containing protein 1 [Polyodon spathula]
MGCGNSKTTAVQPAVEENKNICDDKTQGKVYSKLDCGVRKESAASKRTTDSGLGLDGEAVHLPGAVPNKLSPLRGGPVGLPKDSKERQKSSDIMEELVKQGIIQSHPRLVRNGEAYDIMVESSEKQLKNPPLRLETLKTKKKRTPLTMEDIEKKMKSAEERRKTREEELNKRLRTKKPLNNTSQSSDETEPTEATEKGTQEAQSSMQDKVLGMDKSVKNSEEGTHEVVSSIVDRGLDKTLERNEAPVSSRNTDTECDSMAIEADITFNSPNDSKADDLDDIF